METRGLTPLFIRTNENKMLIIRLLLFDLLAEEKTLQIEGGDGRERRRRLLEGWDRGTERKTHDRDNNGEAVRSRGYAQWQSARHCQSGVNCQLRGRGIQLRRVEIRTRGTHFSFFRSFAPRFHSFDELSNRARRFFLDLIRPKISTIKRKKFKTCELFSKTWYPDPTTFHVSRVWTTEGEAKRSDSCEGGRGKARTHGRKFRATGSRIAVSGGLVVVRWA